MIQEGCHQSMGEELEKQMNKNEQMEIFKPL